MSFPLQAVLRRVLILGVACALLPQAGVSQSTPPPGPEVLAAREVLLTAEDRLAALDDQLRRGEWLQARLAALRLIEETRTQLVGTELAGPVSRLALAEAGWGHRDAAVWHWHVAQNLDRSILSTQDLASFGAPGELLARHPLRTAGAAPAGLTVFEPEDPEVRAGRRVQGEIPKLPQAVAALPVPKGLRVQVVVAPDGSLREPVVLAGSVPGVVWEVLESLRDWRYEPARKGEDTVAVFRTVSVNNPSEKPLTGIAPLPEQRAEVEGLLRAGRWRGAGQLAEKLWKEVFNTPGNTLRDLAAVMTLRALADAGLGRQSQAVCRWQAAQHLDPHLYDADLSSYGTAGALLEKNRWGAEPPGRFDSRITLAPQHEIGIPKASRILALEGTIKVAATLGRDGGLRQPLLLGAESLDQTLLKGLRSNTIYSGSSAVFASRLVALNALDCMCDWRFATGYPSPVQVVFGIPFEIDPIEGFVPASGSGWRRNPYTGAGSPRHYPQPQNPNGPRTPVPQIVPPPN